ncbi:hypothetical protein SGLAD_v1c04320 [Spiroplasma gladiatoris]|uniref:Uncharacterized protein n=1 Tax=Spiroplasma gladiatoris TaxID=2143 RepID=A0A4P7AHM8_9MOLU|nr:DUF296 domain-containing protein [Spiroplasma gladiatoris]QBQ07631.1 hypothetical protein SGLAD_v1c04320 [Spiroplasma gladiatoris]
MQVRERADFIILYFSKNEDIIAEINKVVREYMITEAKVTGSGYLNRLEYGILAESDPIFFKKFLVEKLLTVTNFQGRILERELSLMINAVDSENIYHSGKVFSTNTENDLIMTMQVLRTE